MISKTSFIFRKDGTPGKNCLCRYPELVENYDKAIADKTQIWECHHRKEEFYTQRQLEEMGEYFDVPPEDLIFLTRKEHHNLEISIKRNSESHKGKRNSEEAIRKMIESSPNKKRVLCIETGLVYESVRCAAISAKVCKSAISHVCTGYSKTAGGYHWRYV